MKNMKKLFQLAAVTTLLSVSLPVMAIDRPTTEAIESALQNGINSFQMKNYDKAQTYLEQALKLEDENRITDLRRVSTNNYLGMTYAAKGDFKKAQEALTAAMTGARNLTSGNPDFYLSTAQGNLAQVFLQQADFKQAETEANKALDFQKRLPFISANDRKLVLRTLASALLGQNRDQEAMAIAKDWLMTDGKTADEQGVSRLVGKLKEDVQRYVDAKAQQAPAQ